MAVSGFFNGDVSTFAFLAGGGGAEGGSNS
jgi:hypothetical protein